MAKKKKAPSSEKKTSLADASTSQPPKPTPMPFLSAASAADDTLDFPRGAAPQISRSDRVSSADQMDTSSDTLFKVTHNFIFIIHIFVGRADC